MGKRLIAWAALGVIAVSCAENQGGVITPDPISKTDQNQPFEEDSAFLDFIVEDEKSASLKPESIMDWFFPKAFAIPNGSQTAHESSYFDFCVKRVSLWRTLGPDQVEVESFKADTGKALPAVVRIDLQEARNFAEQLEGIWMPAGDTYTRTELFVDDLCDTGGSIVHNNNGVEKTYGGQIKIVDRHFNPHETPEKGETIEVRLSLRTIQMGVEMTGSSNQNGVLIQ